MAGSDEDIRQFEATVAALDEMLRKHERHYSPAVLAANGYPDIPAEPRRVVPWQ